MTISTKFKENVIANLYSVFKPYKLNKGFESRCCPCCYSRSVEPEIYTKEIHELTEDELGLIPTKALSTLGDNVDFRYFLPRILELNFYKNYGWHWLVSKLSYDECNFFKWPINEIKAVFDYAKMLTDRNCYQPEYEDDDYSALYAWLKTELPKHHITI